jgi:hypothetical protein
MYYQLSLISGEKRVIWEDRPKYDFSVLNRDITTTKYFIEPKTTGKGIANSDNVQFFIQIEQRRYLNTQQVHGHCIIARVFVKDKTIDAYYLKKIKNISTSLNLI